MEWRQFTLNEEKFRELVLYIAHRSQNDWRFGATKLNKLLYYIDTRSYVEHGTPITGATYRHLPAGPVPSAILEAKRQLIDSGHAEIVYRPYFNYHQERLVPQREPKTYLFTAVELALVDDVITQLWEYNGTELSDFSHKEWGWQLTDNYEDIPYELVWLSKERLTIEDIEHGRAIAAKLGNLSG